MQRVWSLIARILASQRFYYGVLTFFAVSALWVAFSAVYPMAFDEEFHLGVIKIYSEQWSPFLSGQPEGANAFGALAADPSYLYHYLMSFPYRLVAEFTDSIMIQVIFLRLINLAIFAAGFVLFRKLLLRAGTSPALTNTALLLFALIPIVPLLAGQINYDSLVVLLLAWSCLLVLELTEAFKKRELALRPLVLLAVATMTACVVKYAFLPLALAIWVYVVAFAVVTFWRQGTKFISALQKSYKSLSNAARLALLLALFVSGGLFMQRYAANTITYGHPVPDCAVVIGKEACMEYGPWARNERYSHDKTAVNKNPLAYTWTWLQSLHYRLFFMINGPTSGYVNYPPSPFPSAAAVVILLFGLFALLFYWRQVFVGNPFLIFILLLAAVYALVLWSENYSQFIQTGQPVAINGRYLIPVLLPLAIVWGRGLSVALPSWRSVKPLAAVLVIVLFLQGGGVFGFIVRSDETWYWNSDPIIQLNDSARTVISPLIFEGSKYY